MANETLMQNKIDTRIALKIDTLTNWNNSTFIPLKGEVCLVEIETNVEGSNLKPIMFKVGDNVHKFSELDWASAKAADVYGWAKAVSLPIDGTLAEAGKFVKGLEWKENKLVPVFESFATTIADGEKIAPTTDAIKKYIDQEIADVVAQGTVVAAGDKLDVAQEGNTYTVSHEAIDAPTATDGTGRTYITGVTTDGFGHITGYTTATESDQDLSGYKTKQTAVAEKGAANQTLKISQNENGEITTAAVDIEITAAQVSDFGTEVAKVKVDAAVDADKLGGTAAADYATKAYADQAEADAIATAKQYTDEVKAGILGEGITETFDTLKEIEEWIEKQGGEAVDLSKAIADESKAREEADEALDAAIKAIYDDSVDGEPASGILATYMLATDGAIGGIQATIGTYGDIVTHNAAEFEGAGTASELVEALKTDLTKESDPIKVSIAAHADFATNAQDALSAVNAETAANATKLNGQEASYYEGLATTAENNAKGYADGLNTAMDERVSALEDGTSIYNVDEVQETVTGAVKYLVFNCGSATTLID